VPHVRLHGLRHTAQVYAAEAGATLPELMARLGHVTPPPWFICTPVPTARGCSPKPWASRWPARAMT